jgi:hypothetical protein
MPYVFDKIGRTQSTQVLNDLVEIIAAYHTIPQQDLYRNLSRKCTWNEFQDILASAINAGFVKVEQHGDTVLIKQRTHRAS